MTETIEVNVAGRGVESREVIGHEQGVRNWPGGLRPIPRLSPTERVEWVVGSKVPLVLCDEPRRSQR